MDACELGQVLLERLAGFEDQRGRVKGALRIASPLVVVALTIGTATLGIALGEVNHPVRKGRLQASSTGHEVHPKRIVYVVDRSGSMILTFHFVLQHLKESIQRLISDQQFHIILFSEGKFIENPPRTLIFASQANKRDAFQFLETIAPEGRSDPTEAMRRAFEFEPDVIFFFSDGDFDPNLLDTLSVLNREKKVQIYTYCHEYQLGNQLMEEIAREHEGRYQFVSDDDLSHEGIPEPQTREVVTESNDDVASVENSGPGAAPLIAVVVFVTLVMLLVLILRTTKRRTNFITCQNCHCSNPPFARFCRQCGKSLA